MSKEMFGWTEVGEPYLLKWLHTDGKVEEALQCQAMRLRGGQIQHYSVPSISDRGGLTYHVFHFSPPPYSGQFVHGLQKLN